ncbi:MAG: ABC transporter ATP-binding protein [Clostridia bacterium]|nr:ABC transporter ATP-binding protein [Clostridia bacterium]
MSTLKKLFPYFKPYMGVTLLYLLMGIITVLLAMLLPQITKHITASVIGDTPFSLLGFIPADKKQLFVVLAVSWLLIVLIRQGVSYGRSYMMTVFSAKIACKLRRDVFDCFLKQSQEFIRGENTGNFLTVINHDTEMIKQFYFVTLPSIIESLLGFIFASVMIWQMNPFMMLGAYIFALPLMFFTKRSGSSFRRQYSLVREASASLNSFAQENINGIRVVKSFAQEKAETEKFAQKSNDYRLHGINTMKLWSKNYVPVGIISVLPNVLLTAIGAIFVINANLSVENPSLVMTIAEFVAFSGYLAYILLPFEQMTNWVSAAQQVVVSSQKVLHFLEMGSTVSSKPNAKNVKKDSVHIQLKDASISIAGTPILENINIDIPQGKSLGIIGKTGSGKSFLTNLITRFYDVTSGGVYINSNNVQDLYLPDLRACFALVPQDVFLFSETIAKNIAYGRSNATIDDVRKCAEIAQAHSFIMDTPDGYDTIIGERGMGLSGGQKQRISIARALLFDSPVMIFDDATSALDMETEKRLYSALNESFPNKTKIIIAHRISSVMNCDEIIVLDRGKIVERGTHEELVAMKQKYFEIYSEQYSNILNSI